MYLRHNYLTISVTKVFSSFHTFFHLVKRKERNEFMFLLKLKRPINVILVVLAYKSDLNKNFLVLNIFQQVF